MHPRCWHLNMKLEVESWCKLRPNEIEVFFFFFLYFYKGVLHMIIRWNFLRLQWFWVTYGWFWITILSWMSGIVDDVSVSLHSRWLDCQGKMYVLLCSWMKLLCKHFLQKVMYQIGWVLLACGRLCWWRIYLILICEEWGKYLNCCRIGFSLLQGENETT